MNCIRYFDLTLRLSFITSSAQLEPATDACWRPQVRHADHEEFVQTPLLSAIRFVSGWQLDSALGYLHTRKGTSLVSLDLGDSPPEDGDLLALYLASNATLVSLPTLVSLNLRGCGISPLGARALSRLLNRNPALIFLE